jgi:Mg2+-importing ATPase
MAGLNSLEAAKRLKEFGPNLLKPPLHRAVLLQFLAQFRNPLVLILLAASLISALTGDAAGALIIALIVGMSVTLDFVQAYRAGRAAEQLALQVAVTATVLRDGAPCERPVSALVPGDVVLLSAGNLIPADAQLLEANDFFVNQAQLTGEPYPVEKKPRIPALEVINKDVLDGWALGAEDRIFMGSSVVSGSASALIGRTGSESTFGQIALSLADKAPPTAFEIGTRRFGMLIMRLTLLLVLFTLLVNVALQRSLLESCFF